MRCNRPGYGVRISDCVGECVLFAELHSHAKKVCAKKGTCVKQSYSAVVMFAVMVFRSNLIRSKENERERKLIRTGVSSGYRLAVNGRAC
jgi:hypothetical protein